MSRDANTAFAGALVDEWARAGIRDACIAPGSRSTPLALALARDTRLRVHVHLDERSAAFFALGLARASGRPVVALCTSGTAAANFHPAVLEAHHSRVPLLVCTADRPAELHDTGAPQTVDQTHLYGRSVRWYVRPDAPADVPGIGRLWRSLAARSVAEASGPPAGPVHLDLPFREPLVPTGAPLVDSPGRPDGRPWTAVERAVRAPSAETVDRLAADVAATPRGLVVAGWGAGVTAATVQRLAAAAGWPVLADAISGVRTGPHAVATYEALLRAPGFADAHRPDLVVRVGAALTSKIATQWLDAGIPHVVVDPDATWADPERVASRRVDADTEALMEAVAVRLGEARGLSPWLDTWRTADAAARRAIDALLDASDEPNEARIARDVVAALPDGATLLLASSMPVRDVEWFAAPRSGLRIHANRGANGIDGFVATVLGTAAATPDAPTVALLGDLCFLHDGNGLLGAAARGVDAVFVVLDNDGGGIFSFLPQAPLPEFETLFGTPHGLDLVAVATAFGVPARRVTRAGEVVPALHDAMAAGGVQVVVASTDRVANVEHHRGLWAAVTRALS